MKRKGIIIIIVICIVILLGATIFSIAKFNVWNPFSSCFGMLEILLTDKEYTIVQNIPNRVVFSKTGDTSDKSAGQYLNEYMKSRGFTFIPEEQMGGMLVYSNGSEKEHILFSANKYYSEWEWLPVKNKSAENTSQESENVNEKDTTNEDVVSIINNVNITDISYDFPIEEAIKQNCFVITENAIYNKNVLDRFVKNTEMSATNRIPDKIRIVAYNINEEPTIQDLEYKILDEKYINEDGQEVNKTGYRLLTDLSRIQSWEIAWDYKELLELQKIKINDDIPGEYYGITVVEDEGVNAVSVSLELYAQIHYNNSKDEPYENIEITRYLLDAIEK